MQTIQDLEKKFEGLRGRYSQLNSVKLSLIISMQKNLKNRTDKKEIVCLDGNSYKLDSTNVEELVAIHTALKNKRKQEMNNANNKAIRETMLKNNKYGPDNPYLPGD